MTLARELGAAIMAARQAHGDPIAAALGVMGGDQLAERAARIVADENDVVQVQGLHEVGNQLSDGSGTHVGVCRHRQLVGAERQVWDYAAVARGQRREEVTPEATVHHQPVHEDNRASFAHDLHAQ